MATDKLPLVLSRKLAISIKRNLKLLIDRTYGEDTIKMLLIDLREFLLEYIYQSARNNKTKNEVFDPLFKDLRDICDCIAHSNRDRGVIEENIRSHIKKIIDALDAGNKTWDNVGKVDKLINGDSVVGALVSIINLFILKTNSTIERDQLIQIFHDKSNISLCIISLLQDIVVELENKKDLAILHVRERDGTYRLYCNVFVSLDGRVSNIQSGRPGYFTIGFPVIITSAKNIDGLHFYEQDTEVNFAKDWSAIKHRDEPPPLIETYRGEDKKLHVKFVEDF